MVKSLASKSAKARRKGELKNGNKENTNAKAKGRSTSSFFAEIIEEGRSFAHGDCREGES